MIFFLTYLTQTLLWQIIPIWHLLQYFMISLQ